MNDVDELDKYALIAWCWGNDVNTSATTMIAIDWLIEAYDYLIFN